VVFYDWMPTSSYIAYSTTGISFFAWTKEIDPYPFLCMDEKLNFHPLTKPILDVKDANYVGQFSQGRSLPKIALWEPPHFFPIYLVPIRSQ